ncbi:putative alpha-methylacyl- racemase protein [Zalerion maritima]|uniref:Alpha-methylacyl- racemase protein n=1 Tax=Zalerion maritima TaxID=339359 RepID=A0AAD5WTM4_9PEZI|nr:putative alpha-methylacyl- racemase protein [Zalerion maritima]
MTGQPPLVGLKVLEFAGLAPGPFAGMLLADAGASVLRIDRASPNQTPTDDLLTRHKSSIAVNLKSPEGVDLVKELARHADVVIDPFRPGVLERLGLGPDALRPLNNKLIYGRMTGFRRDGKYKDMAGHDINYLAVSGVLGLLGRDGEKPTPPWNILADFAGGGAALFQGILLALAAREKIGVGQVVEANMVDGASYLATFPRFALKTPLGCNPRGQNLLDTGCPYYDTYETLDGKFMAVGALEPQFFSILAKSMGFDGQGWEGKRYDTANWPELKRLLEGTFKTKTRAEWEKIFDGTDACCTPVLEYREMESNPQREGDQRPSVTLLETPCLAVKKDSKDSRQGQGKGVSGEGYEGQSLAPGGGGDKALGNWLGWTKGRDFDVEKGAFILKTKSRL